MRRYLLALMKSDLRKQLYGMRMPDLERRLVEIGSPDMIAAYLLCSGRPCPGVFDAVLEEKKHLAALLVHAVVTLQARYPFFEELALSKAGWREPNISDLLAEYCIYILKGRWPEAEPFMENGGLMTSMYFNSY